MFVAYLVSIQAALWEAFNVALQHVNLVLIGRVMFGQTQILDNQIQETVVVPGRDGVVRSLKFDLLQQHALLNSCIPDLIDVLAVNRIGLKLKLAFLHELLSKLHNLFLETDSHGSNALSTYERTFSNYESKERAAKTQK